MQGASALEIARKKREHAEREIKDCEASLSRTDAGFAETIEQLKRDIKKYADRVVQAEKDRMANHIGFRDALAEYGVVLQAFADLEKKLSVSSADADANANESVQ